MSAEPKQTKWGGKEGKAIGPIRLEQRARVTLPLPVSVVGVCCCVNYSSSRSRRREQPSWNRFKWNVPPGSKQLPSCPAGRDSTRPPRAGLRARPAGLCARVLRGRAHLLAVGIARRIRSDGAQVQGSGGSAAEHRLPPSPPSSLEGVVVVVAGSASQGARAFFLFLFPVYSLVPGASVLFYLRVGWDEDGNRWLRRNRGRTRDSAAGWKVHGLPDTVSWLQTRCPSSDM